MRLVVVGGSDAGIAAALRAPSSTPRSRPPWWWPTPSPTSPSAGCPTTSPAGLPYYLSGDVADWRDLAHRTTTDLEAAGLRLLLDHTARAIDPAAKQVTITTPDGGERQLGYDQLVIGTGAVPVRPPIDGLDLPGVHELHTMDDTFALHQALTAGADLVLVVVGVRPDTELAVAAGVATGVRGALRVDRRMRTNLPDVLAAGDCVETYHRLLEEPAYLPLGTTAHKQGRIAGETAVGGDRAFAGSLGTQVVKVFELAVARTGLRDPEAREAGFDPLTVASTQYDHKAYYPGAHQLHLRLTGDRQTGRLLGAQLVGDHRGEVAKRVDIPANALFHHMTVDGLSDLDLSYTPPFGSPWDAVQLAAHDWVRQARTAPA